VQSLLPPHPAPHCSPKDNQVWHSNFLNNLVIESNADLARNHRTDRRMHRRMHAHNTQTGTHTSGRSIQKSSPPSVTSRTFHRSTFPSLHSLLPFSFSPFSRKRRPPTLSSFFSGSTPTNVLRLFLVSGSSGLLVMLSCVLFLGSTPPLASLGIDPSSSIHTSTHAHTDRRRELPSAQTNRKTTATLQCTPLRYPSTLLSLPFLPPPFPFF